MIARDELRKATLDLLGDVAAPPACGPLRMEFNKSVEGWRDMPISPDRIKVSVLPPCDENSTVETWATQRGHGLRAPPAHDVRGKRAVTEAGAVQATAPVATNIRS
jgi:hypothetical protein